MCDAANERYREQIARAQRCRYPRMALEIVGKPDKYTNGRGFVYSSDYSGEWQAEFGDDEWTGD